MTAPLLQGYVAGRWYSAPDEGTPIADAVTGETVARISSTGLDVPAMLDHARTVGGRLPGRSARTTASTRSGSRWPSCASATPSRPARGR